MFKAPQDPGSKIRLCRFLFGLSQKQLAELAKVNLAQLNKLEQHKYFPPDSFYANIADSLKLNNQWLQNDRKPIFQTKLCFFNIQISPKLKWGIRSKYSYTKENVESVFSYLLDFEEIKNCMFFVGSNNQVFVSCGSLQAFVHYFVFWINADSLSLFRKALETKGIAYAEFGITAEDKTTKAFMSKLFNAFFAFYDEPPTSQNIRLLEKAVGELVSFAGEPNAFLDDFFQFLKPLKPQEIFSPVSLMAMPLPPELVGIEEDKEKESARLSEKPLESLQKIKKTGVRSLGQLFFLAARLETTYYRVEKEVYSPWVINLVKVFQLCVKHTKTLKMIAPAIASYLHENGETLDEKLMNAQAFLEGKVKVHPSYALNMVQSFMTLLSIGDISMTRGDWEELNQLLSPWAYWVAMKGLRESYVDMDPADIPVHKFDRSEMKSLELKGTKYTMAHVYLPFWGEGPLKAGKRGLSCGVSFIEGQREKIIFSLTAESIISILDIVGQLDKGRLIGAAGEWEIFRDEQNQFANIRSGNVRVSLLVEEVDDFIELVKVLYFNEDIRAALVSEFLDQYGAV